MMPGIMSFSISSIIASISDIPGTKIRTEEPWLPTDAVISVASLYSLSMLVDDGADLHVLFSHSLLTSCTSFAFFDLFDDDSTDVVRSSTKYSLIGKRRAPTNIGGCGTPKYCP